MPKPHKQPWVKVEAPVDEGIADLVSAMSALTGLETIESCRGDTENRADALVIFRYGSWRECGALRPALPTWAKSDTAETRRQGANFFDVFMEVCGR